MNSRIFKRSTNFSQFIFLIILHKQISHSIFLSFKFINKIITYKTLTFKYPCSLQRYEDIDTQSLLFFYSNSSHVFIASSNRRRLYLEYAIMQSIQLLYFISCDLLAFFYFFKYQMKLFIALLFELCQDFYYLIFAVSVSIYMNKPPTIKLITLQPKPNPNYIPRPPTPPPSNIPINHNPIQTHPFLPPPSNSPLIPSFSIELSQAMITIQQLMQENRQLKQKLGQYQMKVEYFRIVEEELEFRREQQRQMNEHIQYYMGLCSKFRAKIEQLEQKINKQQTTNMPNEISRLKKSQTIRGSSEQKQKGKHLKQSIILSQSQQMKNSQILQDSKVQVRKSTNESQKQNHPLTPKSRVNLTNISNFIKTQLDVSQVKMKKKVFF